LTPEELVENPNKDSKGTLVDSKGTSEDRKEDIEGQSSKTPLHEETTSEEKTSLDRQKKKTPTLKTPLEPISFATQQLL
jgi:hypothetical protein